MSDEEEFAALPPPLKKRALEWARTELEREQAHLAVPALVLPKEIWRLIADNLQFDASSLRALYNTSASVHHALLPLEQTLDDGLVRIPWLRRLIYRLCALRTKKDESTHVRAWFSQTELAEPRRRYINLYYSHHLAWQRERGTPPECHIGVKICKYTGLMYSSSDVPVGEISMDEPERLIGPYGNVAVKDAVAYYGKAGWDKTKQELAELNNAEVELQKALKGVRDPAALLTAAGMRFNWLPTPFDHPDAPKL